MYFDLSLQVQGLAPQERRAALAQALALGWGAVAVDAAVPAPVSPKHLLPQQPIPIESLLAASPQAREASLRLQSPVAGAPQGFQQLRRITVLLPPGDDAADVALASLKTAGHSGALQQFHVIAVQPNSSKALAKLCASSEVDLISIDISKKLPFKLRFPLVASAIQRSIFFELTYSCLLNPDTLRQAIINAQMIRDITRGKHLILSSGAQDVASLRSPLDASSLASLLHLSRETACRAMAHNCRLVLEAGRKRRMLFKGAIHLDTLTLHGGEDGGSKAPGEGRREEVMEGVEREGLSQRSNAESVAGRKGSLQDALRFTAPERKGAGRMQDAGGQAPGGAGPMDFLSLDVDSGWRTVESKPKKQGNTHKNVKTPGKRKKLN